MDMDTDERAELDILGSAMAEARELLAEARADLEAARAREGALRVAVAGAAGPWPLVDTLLRMAQAVDHLLAAHNCDAHGYESAGYARDAARVHAGTLRSLLAAPAPPPGGLLELLKKLDACARGENVEPGGCGHQVCAIPLAAELRAAIGLPAAEDRR
jgi:hypothetical protein